MSIFTSETIYWIIFAIPSIIIASTVHEYAHAWTATKLGDYTAKAEGRLTLNPLSHIDPIGALCMVIFHFGWSKPVPINEYNFNNRARDTALVSLAGPLSNILLLLITALFNYMFKSSAGSLLLIFLFTFGMINAVLAIFNLLPIPPLDGHKIVSGMLPRGMRYYWDNLAKYSIILIIILMAPVFPFGSIASLIINSIMSRILLLLGFL